jgi:hypothetical protein
LGATQEPRNADHTHTPNIRAALIRVLRQPLKIAEKPHFPAKNEQETEFLEESLIIKHIKRTK